MESKNHLSFHKLNLTINEIFPLMYYFLNLFFVKVNFRLYINIY